MSAVVRCTACGRRFSLGVGHEDSPCLFCRGVTERIEETAPETERTSANHERCDLSGVEMEKSEQLLVSIFGERTTQ